MSAPRVPLTRAQYEQIARDYFDVRQVSGDELVCICPFHGDRSPSLWFNVTSGLWYCFTCHEKGNHLSIAENAPAPTEDDELRALLEALGPEKPKKCHCAELYAQVRAFSSGAIDKSSDHESDLRRTIAGRSRRALPETPPTRLSLSSAPGMCEACSRPRLLDEDYLAPYLGHDDLIEDYWMSQRGLSRQVVDDFRLGFDTLRRTATVPVRDHEGHLLGMIRRRMQGRPKYLNPRDFPKTTMLFGSWLLPESAPWVVLCEGPVDVMKVHMAGLPAVGMYGSALSYDQVRLLRYLDVQGVVVFTDAENEGRQADRQACRRLTENDFWVRSVTWGKRRKGDPGGLSTTQIRGLVQRSTWINPGE